MEAIVKDLNPILQMLIIMSVFSLLPFAFACLTSFMRFIIVFSIIDMSSPTNTDTDSTAGSQKKNVSSQLSFLRVFRIFRVVRLTKILRRIKSMRLIIVSISKAIINVSYIVCIILMFILIFVLELEPFDMGGVNISPVLDFCFLLFKL